MHLHLLEHEMMHFLCSLLISITELHLFNCVIVVLLYVLNMVVSYVAASLSSVVLGNNVLNILNGIMLPLQPMSTVPC